jgi:cysteinyl-tRNA synthetase
MSIKYLGEEFDIHTGGIDHVPVHHTNERAQNFAATGHEVVRRWMHNAFLTVGDARMGKSEGNLKTIAELQPGTRPLSFRYLCHTASYRMPLAFSAEAMRAAQNAYLTLVRFCEIVQEDEWTAGPDDVWVSPYKIEFVKAIADDLNVPQALAAVWGLVREGNKRQDRRALDALIDFDRVLGLDLAHVQPDLGRSAGPEVHALARRRDEARRERNWSEADRLRDEIAKLGHTIEDTPAGYRLKPRP